MSIKSEEVQSLEKQWELLKFELELLEDFYDRCDGETQINIIHDIQSLMSKIQSGVN